MSKKRFELQIPARLYERANAKAQSMGLSCGAYMRMLIAKDTNVTAEDVSEKDCHTCEECRHFNSYYANEGVFTICTSEVAHNTKGDKINIEYKKVNAEDVACEQFEKCFKYFEEEF